jgi:hypothetical protein
MISLDIVPPLSRQALIVPITQHPLLIILFRSVRGPDIPRHRLLAVRPNALALPVVRKVSLRRGRVEGVRSRLEGDGEVLEGSDGRGEEAFDGVELGADGGAGVVRGKESGEEGKGGEGRGSDRGGGGGESHVDGCRKCTRREVVERGGRRSANGVRKRRVLEDDAGR